MEMSLLIRPQRIEMLAKDGVSGLCEENAEEGTFSDYLANAGSLTVLSSIVTAQRGVQLGRAPPQLRTWMNCGHNTTWLSQLTKDSPEDQGEGRCCSTRLHPLGCCTPLLLSASANPSSPTGSKAAPEGWLSSCSPLPRLPFRQTSVTWWSLAEQHATRIRVRVGDDMLAVTVNGRVSMSIKVSVDRRARPTREGKMTHLVMRLTDYDEIFTFRPHKK